MERKISNRLQNIVLALPVENEIRVLEIGCGSGAMAREISKYLFETIGKEKSEWTSSQATKYPAAASGLRLTSRDMLKLGILYQNQGIYGEEQIIPENCIQESFPSNIDLPFGGYGFQLWIFNIAVNGTQLKIPSAVGNGDQRIFFDKKNNLVVVTTSGNYNKWDIENHSEAILKKIYSSFELSKLQ